MLKLLCNQLNILLKVKIRFYLRNYPGEQCDQGPHSTVQRTVIFVEAFTYYKRYEYMYIHISCLCGFCEKPAVY